MGCAERRAKIIGLLALRRYETANNLARELGVSERTIRRDIEVLSLTEPIYMQSGHNGGVYFMDGSRPSRTYRDAEKAALLRELYGQAANEGRLTPDQLALLFEILSDYEAPFQKNKTITKK